jgi:hypothetical protein
VFGTQHLSSTTRRHWRAQHVTACFVLQVRLLCLVCVGLHGCAVPLCRAMLPVEHVCLLGSHAVVL